MINDKIAITIFTALATVSAFITLLTANPTPSGVAALTFSLLAIAWKPR